MLKKVCALSLAGIFVAGSLAGCGNNSKETTNNKKTEVAKSDIGNTSVDTTSQEDKYKDEIVITAIRATKETVNVKDDLLAKVLKEKFNIVLDVTEIPNNDYVTKMSLIFASGEAPDFFYSLRPEWNLNEWTEAGYLKGLTQDEVKQYLPNYVNVFSQEEWDNVYSNTHYTDGSIYYFPGKRNSAVDMAWVYRKDTFDKLGLEYPKTTDEMYEVLKAIKESTGRIPYVSANPTQVLWAFSGFLQAFGMPELAIRELSYVDPTTNEFIPYAFSEDNYRDFLIYMNKLYKEGLIWQECATATGDQVTKFQSSGNGYVLWGYPATLKKYDSISQNTDAEAEWDWSEDMVSVNSDKVFYKRNVYYTADGCGFNANISDEKFQRMTDYLNWAASEEGQMFHTYGVEGVTYEIKDGKPVYLEKFQNPIKAEGEKVGTYGISGSNGFISAHPIVNEIYNPVLVELKETFVDRDGYNFFMAPIMNYTEEENQRIVDIQTSINDARDEYAAKFIMGQVDPSNDTHWEKYLDILNKLGLEELKSVKTAAYKRGLEQ